MSNITKTIDTYMFNYPKLTASYLIGSDNEYAIIEAGAASSGSKTFNNFFEEDPKFKAENLKFLITTHIHLDHSGAVGNLIKKFPKAEIVHHHKTKRHLVDPTRLWESSVDVNQWTANQYGKPDEVKDDLVIPGKKGDIYTIGNTELEIIDAPGHHSYHFSILNRNSKMLFAGDSCGWFWKERNVLFPTTPPPRYDHQLYKETIKNHIKLNPKHLAFTHFGIISEDITEMLYNSLDMVEIWYELVKEYRKDNKSITVREAVNKLIKEKYPEFEKLDDGLKGAMFEIPVMGMFHYLDQMELNPNKIR